MGELGRDGRIDVDVVVLRRPDKQVDLRRNGAPELLENNVLVLHLGADFRRREQALAIPLEHGNLGRRDRQAGRCGTRQQPLAEEREVVAGQRHVLGQLHQAVVLGVKDAVHRGQADVLVDPAVTGDVVRVEQFVVVLAGRDNRALRPDHAVGIGGERHPL